MSPFATQVERAWAGNNVQMRTIVRKLPPPSLQANVRVSMSVGQAPSFEDKPARFVVSSSDE
jgi:hypothetical protein